MIMDGMSPLLQEKLGRIRLLILDVDGVMTDGRIVINDLGQEMKFFDVKDGHGLKLIMRYDVDVVLLTGRQSAVVEHRAKIWVSGRFTRKSGINYPSMRTSSVIGILMIATWLLWGMISLIFPC